MHNQGSEMFKFLWQNDFWVRTGDTYRAGKQPLTGLLMDGSFGGKIRVTDNEYDAFLQAYAEDVANGFYHCLSEQRSEVFRWLADFDFHLPAHAEGCPLKPRQHQSGNQAATSPSSGARPRTATPFGYVKRCNCGTGLRQADVERIAAIAVEEARRFYDQSVQPISQDMVRSTFTVIALCTPPKHDAAVTLAEGTPPIPCVKCGLHLVMPGLYVKERTARTIRLGILRKLESEFPSLAVRKPGCVTDRSANAIGYDDSGVDVVGCEGGGVAGCGIDRGHVRRVGGGARDPGDVGEHRRGEEEEEEKEGEDGGEKGEEDEESEGEGKDNCADRDESGGEKEPETETERETGARNGEERGRRSTGIGGYEHRRRDPTPARGTEATPGPPRGDTLPVVQHGIPRPRGVSADHRTSLMPGLRDWARGVFDEAVYTTAGLRMVYSFKAEDCRSCRNDKNARRKCAECMGAGKLVERRAYTPVMVIDGLGVVDRDELDMLRQNVYVCVKRCSIRAHARARETKGFRLYEGAVMAEEVATTRHDAPRSRGGRRSGETSTTRSMERVSDSCMRRDLARDILAAYCKANPCHGGLVLHDLYVNAPCSRYFLHVRAGPSTPKGKRPASWCTIARKEHGSNNRIYFELTTDGLFQRCWSESHGCKPRKGERFQVPLDVSKPFFLQCRDKKAAAAVVAPVSCAMLLSPDPKVKELAYEGLLMQIRRVSIGSGISAADPIDPARVSSAPMRPKMRRAAAPTVATTVRPCDANRIGPSRALRDGVVRSDVGGAGRTDLAPPRYGSDGWETARRGGAGSMQREGILPGTTKGSPAATTCGGDGPASPRMWDARSVAGASAPRGRKRPLGESASVDSVVARNRTAPASAGPNVHDGGTTARLWVARMSDSDAGDGGGPTANAGACVASSTRRPQKRIKTRQYERVDTRPPAALAWEERVAEQRERSAPGGEEASRNRVHGRRDGASGSKDVGAHAQRHREIKDDRDGSRQGCHRTWVEGVWNEMLVSESDGTRRISNPQGRQQERGRVDVRSGSFGGERPDDRVGDRAMDDVTNDAFASAGHHSDMDDHRWQDEDTLLCCEEAEEDTKRVTMGGEVWLQDGETSASLSEDSLSGEREPMS